MIPTPRHHFLKFQNLNSLPEKTSLLVLPFQAEQQTLPPIPSLSSALRSALNHLIQALQLKEKPRSLLVHPGIEGEPSRVLLMPLEAQTRSKLEASGPVDLDWNWASWLSEPISHLTLLTDGLPSGLAKKRWVMQALKAIEAQHDESHDFRYHAKRRPFQGELREVALLSTSTSNEEQALLSRFQALYQGLKRLKRLANAPANLCTPQTLAKEAEAMAAQNHNLSIRLHATEALQAMGMEGLLSVGRGSTHPPVLIEINYRPEGTSQEAPYLFVGKAVTFDSGGISIKPSAQMHHMKFDMCGGATLFGLMESLSALKCPHAVTCLVAACENMPDGTSYRPGDILKMPNGLTVEVLNTDAEGRLALADALHYANTHFKPKAIIDLATLTGACGIALGEVRSGLFSEAPELIRQLTEASERSNDRVWAMPMDSDYEDSIRTPHADIANTGKRGGSSITAAKFLSHFVNKKLWAHLDIASTAYTSGTHARATGRPLPLLLEYLMPTQP